MRFRIVLVSIAIWSTSAAVTAAQTGTREGKGTTSGFEMMEVERFEDGDPERGKKLYLRYCRGCHGKDGRGGAHTFMPHVGNLTKKDYIEFLPDGYLYTVIAEGGEAVGKSSYMPAWGVKLSDREIKDIIAHIRTLPKY